MKKGSYPRKNNGKNRELMVYNTIVRGKMLIAKVKCGLSIDAKMHWKCQNHPMGAKNTS